MPIVVSGQIGSSSDGRLSAVVDGTGGVVLRVTLTDPLALRVIVRRGTTVVRGADRMRLIGGTAVAYDAEAAPGTVSYTVQAVYAVGFGTVSQTVTVTIPVPTQTSLRLVADPGQRVPILTSTYSNLSRDPRANVQRVLGRADSVITRDVRSLRTFDLTALVHDNDQAALDRLLETGGTMLLQATPLVNLPRMYVQVTSDDLAGFTRGDHPYRQWGLKMTEVARPSTVGSSVRFPGHSYADRTGTYSSRSGSYASRLA